MKSFFRKALGLILAAATALSSVAFSASAADEKITLPKNEAITFVQSMGAGWNLGNAFDATTGASSDLDYEKAWCGAKTTKKLIASVKNAGFDTIRVPVSWSVHVDSDFNISKAWMKRVKQVVGWCLDEGLKVIINVHHDVDKRYYYPDSEHLESSEKYMKKIWSQVAKAFSSYDERVIFETINEPRLKGTDYEWYYNVWEMPDKVKDSLECINKLNQLCVDTIRAAGGNNKKRYIIVGGYDTNGDTVGLQSDYFVMPKDSAKNRLIADMHYYGYSESDYKRIFKGLYEKFIKNGIPVVVTEYGIGLKLVKYENVELCTKRLTSFATWSRNYGICPILWDNNNASGKDGDPERFKYIDRATGKLYYPELVTAFTNAVNNKTYKINVTSKAGTGKATLKWDAMNGATKYCVYQNVNGTWKMILKNSTKTSLTMSGLKADKKYTVAVIACIGGKWQKVSDGLQVSFKVK